jgi:hypothetical protein
MKLKTTFWLKIGLGVYLALYLVEFLDTDLKNWVWNAEQVTVFGLMVLFTFAFIVSWFNQIIAGILFQLWHFLVWIFSLTIWPDAGMVLVLALPVLPFSVFMLFYGLKEKELVQNDIRSKWRIVLQQLMIHYFVLMGLITFVSPNRSVDINLLSYPYLLIPLMFGIVFFAFILSWKVKKWAGITLLSWYILAIIFRFTYPEIPNVEGPILMFGLPILIQGILYIQYSSRFKNSRSEDLAI